MHSFVCVCTNYNGGYPHHVPEQTFYRHLRQADNEGEKRRIRDRKGLTLQDAVNLYLSDQQNASGASQAISGGRNSTKRTAGDADNPPQAKRVRRDDIGDVVGDA